MLQSATLTIQRTKKKSNCLSIPRQFHLPSVLFLAALCNLPLERNNQRRARPSFPRFLSLPNPNSIAGQLTIGDVFPLGHCRMAGVGRIAHVVLVFPELPPTCFLDGMDIRKYSCSTGFAFRFEHRKWNRGRNGLHQLGQPVAPSCVQI